MQTRQHLSTAYSLDGSFEGQIAQ